MAIKRAGHAPGCLSTKFAAAELGVAPSTLRGWITSRQRPEPDWVRIGRRPERSFCPDWLRATRRWMEGL